MAQIPGARRLVIQLEPLGADLHFRHVPAAGYLAARQELVPTPSGRFRPNGAAVDRTTGQAVISFPE